MFQKWLGPPEPIDGLRFVVDESRFQDLDIVEEDVAIEIDSLINHDTFQGKLSST